MKHIYTFLMILLLAIACNRHGGEFTLIPYSDGEKWGFKDQNKSIILEAKYDDAYAFSEGLAAVKTNGKWGYINYDGKEVIAPVKYEQAGSFSEGLCMVCQNGLWGFINSKGKEVIPPEKFDRVGNFSEGLAMACLDGKYGYINKKGKIVIDLKYDFARDFSDNRAKVMQNQRFGFVDKKGNEVVPVKYDMAGEFYNKLVLTRQNSQWALVNIDGDEIVDLKYNYVWDIDNYGFYKVFNNGKYGFINQDGKEIVLLKYDFAEDFESNIALIKRHGKFGIIDRSGREIIAPVFDKLNRSGDGIVMFQAGNHKGFIDYYGNPVIDNDVAQAIGNVATFGIPDSDTFTDPRDGYEYPLLTIGNQTWMGSNLVFEMDGSKCFDTDCSKYGQYYTYEMAQNACPEGWRLPNKTDWNTLLTAQGSTTEAYSLLTSGDFNMPLGGYYFNSQSLEGMGDYGYLWLYDENEEGTCVWFNSYTNTILQFTSDNNHLRNVRCVSDN